MTFLSAHCLRIACSFMSLIKIFIFQLLSIRIFFRVVLRHSSISQFFRLQWICHLLLLISNNRLRITHIIIVISKPSNICFSIDCSLDFIFTQFNATSKISFFSLSFIINLLFLPLLVFSGLFYQLFLYFLYRCAWSCSWPCT